MTANTVAVTTGGTYTGDITIPATVVDGSTTYAVTSIGVNAFNGCSELNSITILGDVVSIGESAFYGCTGLTSITLPNSLTSIGVTAFYGCSGLTSITIPEGVTVIGHHAFCNCTGLSSITIPNSLTSIREATFARCNGLTSITLPNSVTSIGVNAFYDCSNLATVNSLIENASNVMESSAFTKSSGKVAKLNIPFGSRLNYGTDWTVQFTTTAEVPAVITVSDALYATYCSTGNIDFTDSGLDAYIASIYDSETGMLTVTKCNKIPAGEGMLVNGPAATYTFTESCSSAPSVGNQFEGTNADMTLDQTTGDYTNFILGTDGTNAGFYKVGESGTLAAHKAYLPIKTSNLPASSKKLVVEFKNENGQTTDIKTVELNGDVENMIYNLQGQKVENPEHGIYIIKGKKTYIK